MLKGSEGVAIAGETLTPIYSLIANPDIKTFADLKGKVVGLSLAVDTISIFTRKLMAKNGIRGADFKVKELVATRDTPNACRSASVTHRSVSSICSICARQAFNNGR